MAYTLTGQYVYGNGAPRRGRIKLTPSVAIAGDDTVILPSPLTVDLDSGGSFSVPLVGTDDVAYSPSGWVWSCVEVLDGGRTFAFELTADSDIHSLPPVAVPDEYSVYSLVGHDHELADITDAGGAAALDVGTTTGTVAAGDDSRFTDARTPTAHAASHGAGQADAITVAQSQVSGLDTALAAKMSNTVADANSVLYAVTDDTPAALAVAASRIVGRKATGDVSAMTAAEALTVLGVSVTHPNTDDVLVTVAGQTVHYDSGWRNIVSLADGALTVNEGLKVRRVNSSVFLVIGLTTPSGWSSGATLATLPLGFRPGTSDIYLPPAYGGTPAYAIVFRGGEIKAYQSGTYTIRAVPTFTCADGIPASLPGTLISAAPA